MRWLILLLLLVPWGHAQPDADAALAPVQVVVDHVPVVVEATLREARFDGSPDEGDALAAALLAHAATIDDDFDVPAGSAAHRHGLAAALPYAISLAQHLAALPGDAGHLFTADAACRASVETGRLDGAAATVPTGIQAQRGLRATRDALATFQSPPPGIDAGPIAAALQRLDQVIQEELPAMEDCLEELEILANLTQRPDYVAIGDPWVVVRVAPTQMWPTGDIAVFGATSSPGPVQLTGPGLDVEVAVTNQSFRHRHELPLSAPIGDAIITATAVATGNATLRIIQAPSWIDITGPRRIEVGTAATIRVQVTSALPVTGQLLAGEGHDLVDGGAEIPLSSAPGRHRLEIDFLGTDIIAPASAVWDYHVVTPGSSVDEATGGTAGSAGWRGWGDELQALAWLAGLALVAAVVLMLRRRQVKVPRAPPSPAVILDVPRGFFAAVAAFMALLIRKGQARPGTTLREAANDFDELRRFVPAFEQGRYGPDGHDRPTPRGLWRLVTRLGRDR